MWTKVGYDIEYYAHGRDDRQPAEQFEDALFRQSPKLLGKLQAVAASVAKELPQSIGGGLFEKARGYPDLYEVRTIFSRQLARYLAAMDGQVDPPRLVLLHGVAKQTGEPTPEADLRLAARYLADYHRMRQVSPEEADDEQI